MDLIHAISLGAGMAWASGMRLYAVLFAAGLLGRFGYIDLPTALELLEHPAVLGASGFMLLAEFLADKVPAFDTLWDSVHTFIRIPAGAILAAGALGDHDPALIAAAAIFGGTLAAGTHATKAGGRALINTSPEPFSNLAASFGEDTMVAGGLYMAIAHPVLFLVLLALFVTLLVWLLPRIWRGVKLVVAAIRRVFGRADSASRGNT